MAVAQLALVRPMDPRLVLTLIVAFTPVVQASDNSVEVTLEDTPEQQQADAAHSYRRWKFPPPQEAPNSDSNYMQWRYKFLSGSDKRLGSAADATAIKRLVPVAIPPTIRWVSRSVVVVASGCHSDASSSPVRCLYVFEKHGSKWRLTHHYPCGVWSGSNQSMKPTSPLRYNFTAFATTPCRGLSLSR